MRNSKLIQLLSALDSREWGVLQDFVQSPYFNKRKEVVSLFAFLYERRTDLSGIILDKEAIYAAVFPDAPYDEKQLSYQFNYLLRLVEDFLVQESLKSDYFLLQRQKLQELLERQQQKHFNFQLGKARQSIVRQELRSKAYWRDRYWLAEIEAQAFMNQRERRYDRSFQDLSDALDQYYVYEKLRYSCAMVNLEAIGATKYDIAGIRSLIQDLKSRSELDFHLDIYLKIYECLTAQDNEETFVLLRKQVEARQAELAQEERREILLFVINICLRKIRLGQSEYYQQALDLYEMGIRNRTLFVGKNLTHWTFNNVVKLALRVRKYEWLKYFIRENSLHLEPAVRKEAMNFSQAELAYVEGDYGRCLEHLNQVAFTDPQYFLGSRIILIKTFYATGDLDALASQLASFMMFLRRNKQISTDYKQTLLNFCSLLHLILRSSPDQKDKVQTKITSTRQKVEGEWLLQVATELL